MNTRFFLIKLLFVQRFLAFMTVLVQYSLSLFNLNTVWQVKRRKTVLKRTWTVKCCNGNAKKTLNEQYNKLEASSNGSLFLRAKL